MTDSCVRQTFVDYLVAQDLVTETALRVLHLEGSEPSAEQLLTMLPDHGLLTEEEASRAFAAFLGLPFVDLAQSNFDPAVATLLPAKFSRRHALVPFLRVGNEISVAFAEIDPSVLDDVDRLLGGHALIHIASKSQILRAVELQQFTFDFEGAAATVAGFDEDDGTALVEQANALLLEALKMRASDIHIEPQEHFVRIRYRVDGLLREMHRLPKTMQHALVSRLKVMADLDIAETRQPQDGRICVALRSFQYNFRISTVPSLYGEKMVLRILSDAGPPPALERMYFSQTVEDGVRDLITLPNGIVLVTGPTGSGKTTTCYALLKTLTVIDRNVVTIENPIEYELPIATQIQVHPETGLTFAKVLRSVLRQDPDTIFIGEIRDAETARIASEAALTGHLVLSTLHTNNAIQAVVRLVELGVEPYMVAPTLSGVLAQRLVRRLCEHCQTAYTLPSDKLHHFDCSLRAADVTLYEGCGCDHCGGTGFAGRISVHELVVVDDQIRDLILRSAPVKNIATAAYSGGYRTMRTDGLKKALAGLTTIEEVTRVTPC